MLGSHSYGKSPITSSTKHAVPSEWWHKEHHSVPFASCWDLLQTASQNPNEMFQLIVRCTSKMQEDLVNFLSLKTISIAKPSAWTNLVGRIFETSNEFNRQWLIVTFIKPNANIPLSNSEGEITKLSWTLENDNKMTALSISTLNCCYHSRKRNQLQTL
jgi:hypothetical protein